MAMNDTATMTKARQIQLVINDMIDNFDANPMNTQVQSFGYQLRKILTDAGLATREVVHFRHVQPHPDNRDGELLIPSEVWSLMAKILAKGWSWDECQMAL